MSQGRRKVYVSYSRRDGYTFIQSLKQTMEPSLELRSLVIDGSDSASPCIQTLPDQRSDPDRYDNWQLIYDENGLKAFGSIQGFMDELAEGEQIVFLLSKGYFESPYCMTELLAVYAKRAEELMPIVVFVDGFSPGDLQVNELVEYWENQQDDAKLNDGQKRHAAVVAQRLPKALAWLLGRYDDAHGGWNTLFPVLTSCDDNVPEEILKCLKKKPEPPRYRHVSEAKKRRMAKFHIEKIALNRQTREWFQQLKNRFPDQPRTDDKLASRLLAFETLDELLDIFDTLIKWLDDIKSENEPSYATRQLAGGVKELLGWILLVAMDSEKLHGLIHELNREGESARDEMLPENETSFQMIAAAIASAAARYCYSASGSMQLRGEGEINLLERGADEKNYVQWLEDEQNWFDLETRIFQQIVGRDRPQRTRRALESAMQTALRRKKGVYLVIEKELFDIAKCDAFLTMMGNTFPDIHQIISSNDATRSAQDYYRPGIESGAIDQSILDIYQHIHELSQ